MLTQVKLFTSPKKSNKDKTVFIRVKVNSNSILTTRHYPDLGSASDWLRQISQRHDQSEVVPIWVVTRNQYGIYALVSQTSFHGETVGDVA